MKRSVNPGQVKDENVRHGTSQKFRSHDLVYVEVLNNVTKTGSSRRGDPQVKSVYTGCPGPALKRITCWIKPTRSRRSLTFCTLHKSVVRAVEWDTVRMCRISRGRGRCIVVEGGDTNWQMWCFHRSFIGDFQDYDVYKEASLARTICGWRNS